MSLEDLEKELYGFKVQKGVRKQPEIKKPVELPPTEVPETWGEPVEGTGEKKRKFRPLFWIILVSAVVIIVGIVLIFNYLNSSEPQITIEMIVPKAVQQGLPFETIVNVSNQSSFVLKAASLNLALPESFFQLNNPGVSEIRESLGDIGVGGISRRSFTLVAADSNGEGAKKLNLTFSYSAGSGERFEQRTSKELAIQSSAIRLEAKTPEKVLSGSVFETEISYSNQSNFDFKNLVLEISYPQDFKFISSDLTPSSLNNRWDLGELRGGSKGKIKIKGSVVAPPQSFFGMPAVIKADFSGREFIISKADISFSISPSPIAISLVVNNNPEYVARIGDRLSFSTNYQNNSGVALADVVIKTKVIGELFDVYTLQTRANIDSVSRILTWNASNVPEFRLLPPGASGSVNFDIRLLSNFPIKRLNDKNYTLKVEVTIDSPTVPYYLEAEKTSATASIETKVAGLIAVDAQAFYRDAQAIILNLGSMPPKVNQPTQYTVHWIIKNYATDVKNVEVRTFLQSGVSWTNFVKSNIDSVPLYNERTQEVVWTIENIAATKGIVGAPVETIFQIQAVPNATQVGQYQPLISETRIRAVDEFTGLQLENFDTAITTSLPDDVTVGQTAGRVVP